MSIVFDGQTLSNASTYEDNPGILMQKTRLLSGKQYVISSTETVFEPSFTCYTEDSAELTAIRAKIGSKLTLVIDGVSYTKMSIESYKQREYAPGKWKYEISFAQDTT